MQTLGLFVKRPVPGRVKTRLASVIGEEPAARLYTAFLIDLTQRFRQFPAQRCLGFTPDDDDARRYFQHLAGDDYQLWPQPPTDLGRRMFAFFREHLREPGDRAVLIGSDSPSLPSHFVIDAFRLLGSTDIVLGPAADGGYYLVGMNSPAKDIFADIPWSEPTVLQRTVMRMAELRLRLAVLPVWYDVDSLADLQMLHGHLAAVQLAGVVQDCPATWTAMNSLPEGVPVRQPVRDV